MKSIIVSLLLFGVLAAYPLIPFSSQTSEGTVRGLLDDQLKIGYALPTLFVYSILGLALNVVLGYTGQLHLGIAAFFGIGAFTAGVLRNPNYPFKSGLWETLLIAALVTTMIGILLSSPTLRLRGDYLALVTLGFGEITITLLRKFVEITGGQQTINVPPPVLPEFIKPVLGPFNIQPDFSDYRLYYYLCLALLALVYLLLWNLERSRLGRAWFAVREDELAASCMGINTARAKLASFALGAGLAGLAGSLYTVLQSTTRAPTDYGFPLSATILCAIILGGLGNRKGVLLGVLFIMGFENLFAPKLDSYLQRLELNKEYLKVSTWKMMLFGLALILVMRFRPHGLLPAVRGETKR
jgi:branched-chain amino acid transport system permease protein